MWVAAMAVFLMNLLSRILWEIQSFFPKELTWPWAIFLYDLSYISPANRCGTAHLGSRGPLSACFLHLLPLLIHFQGIAMMRALKGGICQRIKNFERHLRVKCNYTDTDMGNVRLRSSNGGEESEEARKFLFPAQLLCFCDREEKYSARIT